MATKKGSPSGSVKAPESFDEVSPSNGVISDEEGGLEFDVEDTDGLSQASEGSDLTSYADDPTYRGVPYFGIDKCRVIVRTKTAQGDPLCCGNEAADCRCMNHSKLREDPSRVADIGYMPGLASSKRHGEWSTKLIHGQKRP
jgi:hypothetical protein